MAPRRCWREDEERGKGSSGPRFDDSKIRTRVVRSSWPSTGATIDRRGPQPWHREMWHCPQCTILAASVGMQQEEHRKGGGLCSSTASASTAQRP